jgi:hypothetical protein
MTRTSTAPYTFTGSGGTGFYFSEIIFDNDGYMTSFCAKYPSIGLDLCASSPLYNNTTVNGLDYYKNNMGRATPVEIYHRLTITVVSDTTAKGGGSVQGDGGISCNGHGSSPSGMSGNCQADFLSGSTAHLTQSPDSDSTWGTWSVSACGTSQSCAVLMSGVQNVTVTFPYSFMTKVSSTNLGYESLASAYSNVGPVDSIYSRDVTFTEDFTLNGAKAITLLGGRNAWYLPLDAWTTLQGILAIQGGSLTVERLAIK